MKKIKIQLRAGHVKRYHTVSIVGEQTVGHHSYGVAQLVRWVTGEECTTELLCAALDHDVAEIVTGDTPHPIKVNNLALKKVLDGAEATILAGHGLDYQLSEYEKKVLKLADLLEMGFYGIHQIQMGNRHTEEVVVNVLNAIVRLGSVTERGTRLVTELEDLYHESK